MLWVDGQISSYFFPLKISIPTRWTYKEKEHQLPSIPWSQMPLKSVLRVPYGASCPLRATREMRFSSHPLLAVREQPKPREGPSRILSHFRSSTIRNEWKLQSSSSIAFQRKVKLNMVDFWYVTVHRTFISRSSCCVKQNSADDNRKGKGNGSGHVLRWKQLPPLLMPAAAAQSSSLQPTLLSSLHSYNCFSI